MLPTQVTFNGMPNTRWWAFEDSRTNFGDIKPDTTDLAKLLLIEFGLVYANDWFLVPFTVPAGSDRDRPRHGGDQRVRRAHLDRGRRPRRRRRLAALGDVPASASRATGTRPADLSLLMPPAAQKVLEGAPLEEVLLARDEMANMVWGDRADDPAAVGRAEARARSRRTRPRAFFERDLERRLGAPPEPPPPRRRGEDPLPGDELACPRTGSR